jgi:hypothetical protein
METPRDAAEHSGIDDRRKSVKDRRSSPRMRTLKGARIVWPSGATITCTVRNFSDTGAKLQVDGPVPGTFELVLVADGSRRPCRVVWRKENYIGVRFL